MLNNPKPTSEGRRPRGLVLINGVRASALIDFAVDNNNFYSADTFRVRLCLSQQPNDTNWAWWAGQTDLGVEIFAGFPANPESYTQADLTSLIYGNVDDIEIDPVRDEIMLIGRDLTSLLIETKTSEKFPEHTSSDIAVKLAERHGLTAQVTKTSIKAGTYYQIEHVRLTDERSEWDLLTYLAHEEGYQVFVRGQSLHFEPKASASGSKYVLRWQQPTGDVYSPQGNFMSMNFARSMLLTKDVIVHVHSWNTKHKKGFTKTARATHKRNSLTRRASKLPYPPQEYSRTIPNLTPEQAQQKAQAILSEITAHEVRLHADMPADVTLTPQQIIQVDGTGTLFDQDYYPISITRKFSWSDGFTMSIEAKNQSPETTVTI